MKARQEAGGRGQEKNNYGIKTGFSIIACSCRFRLFSELITFPINAPGDIFSVGRLRLHPFSVITPKSQGLYPLN